MAFHNQREVVENNIICSSLQQKTLWREKRSKLTFLSNNYSRHLGSVWTVLHTYTMAYSILSIFRATQKLTLRLSRKHWSLLCVFVMKDYLLNCSSMRLKYFFVNFLIPFFAPKLECFQHLKKGIFTFL